MRQRKVVQSRSITQAPTSESLLRRKEKVEECLDLLQPEIAAAMARAPEAEWIFGRLFLFGLINQSQYDAALRLDSTLKRYRSMLAPHGKIKSWRPESLRGSAEDMSPGALKRMQDVQKAYEQMYNCLKQCGPAVVTVIFTMMEKDIYQPDSLRLVYRGLNTMLLGKLSD